MAKETEGQGRRRHRDSLGSMVATCCAVGSGLGVVSFVLLAVGLLLGGLSFGSCGLDLGTVPGAPVRDGLGIAISADGKRLVTVDSAAGLLDVITQGRLTSQVEVGGQTTDVALSPDGRSALVTDTAVNRSAGVLAIVDLAGATVTARITVGSGPTGVVVSPDDRLAYVADTGYIGLGNVDVIDLAINRVVDSIPVGQQPTGLALSANGQRLFVANATLYLPLHSPSPQVPGSISVIDTARRRVTDTVTVGIAPLFVSLAPDGQNLAVGDYGSNALTLVNTTSLLTRTVSVPSGAFGVAYSRDGSRLFVCGGSSPLVDSSPGSEHLDDAATNRVTILDGRTGLITATVPVGADPTGVVVGPAAVAYVAEGAFPAVVTLDPSTLSVSVIGTPGLAPPLRPHGGGHP